MSLLSSLSILPILIFLFVAIFRWIGNTSQPIKDMGLDQSHEKLMDCLSGFVIGSIAMTGIFVVYLLLGYLGSLKYNDFNSIFILLFITDASSAFIEEILCRGILFGGLRRMMPTWLAVVISAIIFGLAHAGNAGATKLSIINNAVGGLMYAFAYLGTESIWISFGLHFSWNTIQGSVLGFPVSGILTPSLINHQVAGPTYLTGGNYGPEGGIIGIGFRLFIIALLFLYFKFIKKINISNLAQSIINKHM